MAAPVLEIVDLRKSYGGAPALNGVSLTVEGGEVFGLLGPNGAGKTTLISIATGLARADSGSVKLFGQEFTPDRRAFKHLVGIGTQDLAIYPDLTAAENLRFFGKLYGLGGRTLSSRVGEVLEAVGLTDRANDRAGTFSGGMKRRLNLAVAVVHGPKLLFLDEPTTGVDPQSRNHIFEQVQRLNTSGMTVVYTSHYMEEVQTLCNRIAILDGGQVRACDTLPNLLKRLRATIEVRVTHAPPDFAERLGEATSPLAEVAGGAARPTPPAPLPAGRGETEPPAPSSVLDAREAPTAFSHLPAGSGAGGVGRAAPPATSDTFTLTVDEVGPALARIANLCAATGAELLSATASEPTLERVFLYLTGRALRD